MANDEAVFEAAPPRVCVIGTGADAEIVCNALRERAVPFELRCFVDVAAFADQAITRDASPLYLVTEAGPFAALGSEDDVAANTVRWVECAPDGAFLVWTQAGRCDEFEAIGIVHASSNVSAAAFQTAFSCLDETLASAPDGEITLWKRMVDPRWNKLFFLGLLEPDGTATSVIALQAAFMASYLTGTLTLPAPHIMEREMVEQHEAAKSGFRFMQRHPLHIDAGEYSADLRQTHREGERRATHLRKAARLLSYGVRAGRPLALTIE